MEYNVENYSDFLNRIFSFQNPKFSFGVEKFLPSESVKSKVKSDGNFSEFIGDTVVFNLDSSQKAYIYEYYIKPLYDVAYNCLAEQLDKRTLHMTLHDLNASAQSDFSIMERMFYSEISIANLIYNCSFKPRKIDMVTTSVFNMVNTSLVLGLKPKSSKDYDELMEFYHLIDSVCKLPYPFTPHITLAYYRPNGFEVEQLRKLEETINVLNRECFEIELSTDKLYYQKFVSMNQYFNIMCLTKE